MAEPQVTDIHCTTLGCRNNLKQVVIGRTNGTAAEVFCGECRKMVRWRAEVWLTPPARERIVLHK